MMINIIQNLWRKERLPIIDGLYKSNGTYFELMDNKVVIADLHKKEYYDWYSDIIINHKIECQGITYCCGEGSWGRDGYTADFIGRVSSAYQEHYHYKNGVCE